MNYQLLIEYYSSGTDLTDQELDLLDLELESQLESIMISSKEGCLKKAPNHVCIAASVSIDSNWITVIGSILDKYRPYSVGIKSRGAKIYDQLCTYIYKKENIN